MSRELSQLDIAVVVAYLFLVAAIGVWVARHVREGDDLFLAGRSLGFGAIGLSLFASNISSTTLVGLTGQAYSTGISVANYEWMAGIIFLFMTVFTIPVFLRNRLTTIPEYLDRRFDLRTRRYFSALTIVLSIFVDTAGSLYAGAVILQTFFPVLPFWWTCMGLAFFAGLYTAAGGLRAVVYTDVVQAVVLIVGSAVLTLSIFAAHGYSWEHAVAGLPEGQLSLIRPLDDEALPWLGTLIGVPVLGFYYWSTNQYIAQRVLAAKSLDDARWGGVLAGLLKLTPLFIMVLPGAMAVSLLPRLDNPDAVFPELVLTILPAGMRGLVLSGLIAAIMSTVDSTLNSASTLVFHDFLHQQGRDGDAQAQVRQGRIITFLFMVVAALWAPLIRSFPGVFHYLQQVFSYAVPPVVAIFIMGMFWRRGTAQAAFWTLVFGHTVGLAQLIAVQAGLLALHFTIVAGLTTGLCIIAFVVLSWLTPAPAPDRLVTTLWTQDMSQPDRPHPWWKDYRVQALAVALLTLATVVLFW